MTISNHLSATTREYFRTIAAKGRDLLPPWVFEAHEQDARTLASGPTDSKDFVGQCGHLFYQLYRDRAGFERGFSVLKDQPGNPPGPLTDACLALLESHYRFLVMPDDPALDHQAYAEGTVSQAERAIAGFTAAGCPYLAQLSRDHLARILVGQGHHDKSLEATSAAQALGKPTPAEEDLCQRLFRRSCSQIQFWSAAVDASVRAYMAELSGLGDQAQTLAASMPVLLDQGADLYELVYYLNLSTILANKRGDPQGAHQASAALCALADLTGILWFATQAMAWQAYAAGPDRGLELLADLVSVLEAQAASLYHVGPERWPYLLLLQQAGQWSQAEAQARRLDDSLGSPSLRGPRIEVLKKLHECQAAQQKTHEAAETLAALCQAQEDRYTTEVKDKLLVVQRAYQENLLKAKAEQLARYDALKDAFLSNTSHDLRTPLQGMVGIAESLLDGADGPLGSRTRRGLELIAQGGQRLAALVDDLLDVTLLKRGEVRLNLGSVNVASLLGQTAELLLSDGSWELQVPPDLPPVLADEGRLGQVLQNLVGNALKFAPSGQITLGAEVVPEGVRVWVLDQGPGIEAPDLDRLFRPFERLRHPTDPPGLGLGLAICKGLIEGQGGHIGVESPPGAGARFWFTLPLAPGAEPRKAPRKPAEPHPVFATEGVVAPRVLVVDDDEAIRQALENQLRLEGCEVRAARSGTEALALADREMPDLVLLDLVMGDLNGLEVLRRLRAQTNPAQVPILLLTAEKPGADLIEAFALGANDYLTKPVSRRELCARLKVHWDLSRRYKMANRLVPRDIETLLAHAQPHWAARGVSRREGEVAELLLCGYGIPEVAQRLFLSRRTVEKHVEHLYSKLGVPHREGLRTLVEAWSRGEGD